MTPTLTSTRLALLLAVAAVAVNAPRLILAFLEADGLPVSPSWRGSLLGLTGVATGVVLTGGGAYLAHALARGARFRRTLAVTWLLVLVCSGVLVTPMLVAGLGRAELGQVLPTPGKRWVWSATAVLAVELVAAGAMVAHAAHRTEQEEAGETERELLRVARDRDRLQGRLEGLTRELEAARETAAAAGRHPCRHGCGAVFSSASGERGHLRACPERAGRGQDVEESGGGEVPA
jgi:MFS family permease